MDKTTRKLILMVVIAAIIGAVAIIGITYYAHNPSPEDPSKKAKILPSFSSCEDLREALTKQNRFGHYPPPVPRMIEDRAATGSDFGLEFSNELQLGGLAKSATGGAGSDDYSTTNVQVQGIDEADIVKTDGKYIYTLSRSNKRLNIVNAYPAESAEMISQSSRLYFGSSSSSVTPFFLSMASKKNPLFGIFPLGCQSLFPLGY